jgi:hypothetical protein
MHYRNIGRTPWGNAATFSMTKLHDCILALVLGLLWGAGFPVLAQGGAASDGLSNTIPGHGLAGSLEKALAGTITATAAPAIPCIASRRVNVLSFAIG